MDGARDYDAKENKLVRERQIPYDLIPMWNEKRGKKGGAEREQRGKKKREPQTKEKTLNYRKQTDG